jgi:hypothetical protein
MTTFYPLDFHRRVDRRWAERVSSTAADAHGSLAHARLAGQQPNEVRHAREAPDSLPESDAARGSSATERIQPSLSR